MHGTNFKGLKRWTLLKKPRQVKKKKTIFFVHDNGGRPFMVTISCRLVKIFSVKEEEMKEHKLLLQFRNPIHIWIGEDDDEPGFRGNSIVIQVSKQKYVFVGWDIYSFRLASNDEQVEEYKSPVENNDVPYPYLVTNKNIYLMIYKKYATKDQFPNEDKDPYDQNFSVKDIKDIKVLVKRR